MIYRCLIILIVNPKINEKIYPDIDPDKANDISPYLAKEIVVSPSYKEFPIANKVLPRYVLPNPKINPIDYNNSKRKVVKILDHKIPYKFPIKLMIINIYLFHFMF